MAVLCSVSCLDPKVDGDWLVLAVIVALKAAAKGYAYSSVEAGEREAT